MRIISGEFRGRELSTPAGGATRPTAARAREALFSILSDVNDARVLDLYAGSGALGLEALSRGAASAVFVEAGRSPSARLSKISKPWMSRAAPYCCRSARRRRSTPSNVTGHFRSFLRIRPGRMLRLRSRY